MTIFRGEGGGGDATTDSEINLITSLANSIVADTAITTANAASATASASAASTSETNAATSETNADLSAIASAASAASSLSSANNSASSAAAALVSENAAAASAASVNDTNLVHITGTETITGAKTFSNTITGSITGNSGTVTNGVYTSGDQTIGGNKTFSNTILGSISGATGVFTGDIQATSYNGGQLAGLRNKLINGNMDVFQRGATAVTVTAGYGPADRWLNFSTGNTFATNRVAFVSGETLYDTGGAQYFTQIGVTSVANAANSTTIQQRIENVRLLAGQTVTVSFWAKAVGTGLTVGVEVVQNFGTGGSPSATATGVGQAQLLTTSWAKYTKTFTLPSLNGKTIGTDANSSFTQLIFWLDAGSDFNTRSGSIGQASKTVSIAQVQLEIGSVATPFEQRPVGMELALCQRYFEKSYGIDIAPGSNSSSGSIGWSSNTFGSTAFYRFQINHKVTKRAAGGIVLYNPVTGSTAAATCVRNNDDVSDTLGSVAISGETGFTVQQASTAIASGKWMLVHYTASSEL